MIKKSILSIINFCRTGLKMKQNKHVPRVPKETKTPNFVLSSFAVNLMLASKRHNL